MPETEQNRKFQRAMGNEPTTKIDSITNYTIKYILETLNPTELFNEVTSA